MRSRLRQAREELGEQVVWTLLDPRVPQGEKLRLLREVRGMSQKLLSQRSGLSHRFISYVESGGRRIGRREVALRLDQALEAGGYLAMGLGFIPDWFGEEVAYVSAA